MANIKIQGLEPGKKYRMVIEAETANGTVTSLPSVAFSVPKAPDMPSTPPAVKITKKTTPREKTVKLSIKIPPTILKSLMWTDTVRDVAHIVYRSADNSKDISGARKYVLTDATLGNTPRAMTFSSGTVWYNIHPGACTIKALKGKKYSFQIVIARYIKSGDTWTGTWLNSKAPIEDRLSPEAIWSSR